MLSLLAVCDDKIENRLNSERIKNGQIIKTPNTANKYKLLRTALSNFVRDKYGRKLESYYFTDITSQFIEDFVFHRKKRAAEKGNSGNVSTILCCLYGICKHAEQLNVPNVDMSAFETTRIHSRAKKFEPKTIPRDVMSKIENFDRGLLNQAEKFYLDLFLFSYYAGGMGGKDVAYLTWSCIDKDGYLDYERIKTEKRARIKLNPKAKEIIDRYRSKCYDNYILPIFTDKHQTDKQRTWRLNEAGKAVSAVLTKICTVIKYKENITWYSARGTFISTMIAAGLNPSVVAGMAGNSPQTIYKHYFKNIDQKETDHAVAQALGC
ncbi:MAG: tyrosine-type recombinase/integrase [Rikenellaceae bacterium]